jgi:pimeloyl-ACP methyl ester carboxylesterase
MLATAAEPKPVPPAAPRLHSVWVKVDGLSLHARVAADSAPNGAVPVVLVHGVGVSSRYMIPTLRRLAPFHPVYAPDLPGFGLSDHPSDVLGTEALADALAAWMGAMGLPSAVVLGNSMGCQVIVDLALRHPGRAERLILADPTGDPDSRALMPVLFWGAVDVLGEPPALWPRLVLDYFLAGPLRTLRTLRRALHDTLDRKLPQVRVPALVVRGGRDRIVSQHWAEQAARLLPHGGLFVIPNGTHATNFSTPAELVQAVRMFLRNHPFDL